MQRVFLGRSQEINVDGCENETRRRTHNKMLIAKQADMWRKEALSGGELNSGIQCRTSDSIISPEG